MKSSRPLLRPYDFEQLNFKVLDFDVAVFSFQFFAPVPPSPPLLHSPTVPPLPLRRPPTDRLSRSCCFRCRVPPGAADFARAASANSAPLTWSCFYVSLCCEYAFRFSVHEAPRCVVTCLHLFVQASVLISF